MAVREPRYVTHNMCPKYLHSEFAMSCDGMSQLCKWVCGKGYKGQESQYTPLMGTLHDITAIYIDGRERKLSEFAGKTLFIINVACK